MEGNGGGGDGGGGDNGGIGVGIRYKGEGGATVAAMVVTEWMQ